MDDTFASPGDETKALTSDPLPRVHESAVAAREPEVEVEVGQAIDRYVLLRPLGSGGMGIVYLAFDPELDRRVALKLLRPDRRADEDLAASRLRLFREAQALARLSHPNVVHVYDVGTFRNRVYLAMEFIEGRTVDQWRTEAPRTFREILHILVRAGQGLAAAHRAGLVHLDFKPKNIVVGDDGEVRVLDFGLAREPGDIETSAERIPSESSADSSSPGRAGSLLASQVTGSDVVMGTPGYVAPEMYIKDSRPDARADQFAFGVTAWDSLYGQFPFEGQSLQELRRNARRGKVREPPRDRKVPSHVHAALLRALDPDPRRRFASMGDLLAELERDPARRNRRIAAGVLAVAGLGASLFAYERARAQALEVCNGAEQRLEGIWDAPRAARVHERFLSTDTPYAAHAAEAAMTLLDERASQWVAMRTDACEATRIRGEQSERLMDLRMGCLDRRLEDIRALAEVFEEADAGVVRNAVQAASELPPLLECADADHLLRLPEQPADGADRIRMMEVDTLISRANVLGSAGRLTDAIEVSEQSVELADTLDILAEQAYARYYLGQLYEERGDGEAAFETLEAALRLAERAGLDTLRGQIYGQLTFVSGRRLGRYEHAHWLADTARSVYDRVDAEPSLRARIDSVEAVVYTEEGKIERAVALYERALDTHDRAGRSGSVDVAAILNNLGSAYYMAHEPKRALEYYDQALERWLKILGPDHPQVALVYGNVGNVHQQLGEHDAAIENIERSMKIERAAKGEDSIDVAIAFNNLGAAYQVAGKLERAVEVLHQAIDIFEKTENLHPAYAVGLSNLAEMLNDLERHEEAREYATKAVARLDEAFEGDHPYKAFAACSLGEALLGVGEVEASVPHLEKAVEIFTETGVDPLGKGDSEFALARALARTPDQGARVATLVEAARASYTEGGKRAEKNLARLERWDRRRANAG